MQTLLDIALANSYKSASQKIRVMTEGWAKENIFCPNCGELIFEYENNRPVADFFCKNCAEEYELKSKKGEMGKMIQDGAYDTMIQRLKSATNPSFFLLHYDAQKYEIVNFAVIPKHFFTPEIIIKRKNGLKTRPNYFMCNIDATKIPESGKIFYIQNGQLSSKESILKNWKKTLFLREQKASVRGWTLDVLLCLDALKKAEFTLDEAYSFDQLLSEKHPENNHIRDKIRQQLQILRDKGYLEFTVRGKYRLI